MRKVLVFVVLFVFQCFAISEEEFNSSMKIWVGMPIDSLILRWGAPSNTFTMPSGNMVVYRYVSDGGTVMSASFNPLENSAGAKTRKIQCAVDLMVNSQNNNILSYASQGDCFTKAVNKYTVPIVWGVVGGVGALFASIGYVGDQRGSYDGSNAMIIGISVSAISFLICYFTYPKESPNKIN